MKLEETRDFVKKVAALKGWIVNPDGEFTDFLIQGLATNRESKGCYLCPCRESSGSKEKDRDIICPCAYSQEDIDQYGQCYCALFLSPAFVRDKREPSSIPERRPV